jgi:predicted ArsR family transcriptional regulator
MITSKRVYSKIQEISSKYISGHPPIHIDMLTDELGLSKPAIEPILEELEAEGKIQFYQASHDAFKLCVDGIDEYYQL